MKGGSKDFWFVLTAESLSWYKDEEVRGFFVSQGYICHDIVRYTWLKQENNLTSGIKKKQQQQIIKSL